jgi:hypothetical protein
MEKELGKISSATFGLGGYQGCQFGLHLQFRMGSMGVGASFACWDPATMECSSHCQWSEATRSQSLDEICRKVSSLLKDAKVDNVSELVGIPVEVTLDGMCYKDFRILTEVL